MYDGRKRTSVIAAFGLALAGLIIAAPSPANAKPDLDTVKKQVEQLNHEAEIASERYNDARAKAVDLKIQLDSLGSDLGRQQTVVNGIRQEVATMVVDQYQGSALSAPSQMVLSANPDAFLDNLNAVTTYNSQRGQVIGDYGVELDRLKLRKQAVGQETANLDKLQHQMLKEKTQIDEKSTKAQQVLDGLEADARAKILAGDWTGPLPAIDATGRAAAAIKYAMAQVGKSYVYGAAGPSAYDCSGLTMRAWGAAGVGLPHSSRAQTGSGRPVSESDLQPGDLVFYYSPVSHVGMYIGHGLIVNAENPSAGVKVTGLHSMPYSGAVRPG